MRQNGSGRVYCGWNWNGRNVAAGQGLQSRRARLERLEELKNGKAPVKDQTVELDSVETRMGKKTVELHHVSKAFGEKIDFK